MECQRYVISPIILIKHLLQSNQCNLINHRMGNSRITPRLVNPFNVKDIVNISSEERTDPNTVSYLQPEYLALEGGTSNLKLQSDHPQQDGECAVRLQQETQKAHSKIDNSSVDNESVATSDISYASVITPTTPKRVKL